VYLDVDLGNRNKKTHANSNNHIRRQKSMSSLQCQFAVATRNTTLHSSGRYEHKQSGQ